MTSNLKTNTMTTTKLSHLYQTVIFNDNDTPFEFVLEVISKRVYQLTQTKAMLRTLLAHHEGRSVIIIAPLEISELRLEQALAEIKKAGHHLKITIEPQP